MHNTKWVTRLTFGAGRRVTRPLCATRYGYARVAPLHSCSCLLVRAHRVRGRAAARGRQPSVALWFVGAALLHDLVLLPLYAVTDRIVARGLGVVGRREWTVYVRIPAAFSGLLLLIWFPLISGQMADHYSSATTLSGDGFLSRWLLITAVLFGGSAVVLLVRSLRSRRATKERPPLVH